MEVYINVRNFGKIKEARINISNFTIFVGNNNSGKTQLMELIYAVIKEIAEVLPEIDVPRIEDIDAFHIGEEEIASMNYWINNYLKDNLNMIIDKTFNISIPIEEVTLDFENINIDCDIYFLKDRTIDYLLGKHLIPLKELLQMSQNDKLGYDSLLIDNNTKEVKKSKRNYFKHIPVGFAKRIELREFLGKMLGVKMPYASNALFLPASRMGLMQLYKYYFGNNNRMEGDIIRESNLNLNGITKPVVDFLSFLLQYGYLERTAKNNEPIIQFIFDKLIDGTIAEKGEITTYTPKDEGKEIPIFVASSMVNEIVPVIKALTGPEKVDFLFYDEVETSMHPLKQIEMAKLFNRLNNHGIRLIISTHSDTMAAKINNLLLLSYADIEFEKMQRSLEKRGILIEKEDLLASRNIHVYQFTNDDSGKSCVEELEFNKVPYTGYDFKLFNDSTMSLFEEAKIVMGLDDED